MSRDPAVPGKRACLLALWGLAFLLVLTSLVACGERQSEAPPESREPAGLTPPVPPTPTPVQTPAPVPELRWVNIPHPVTENGRVEWRAVYLAQDESQVVELLGVDCWLEPPYLRWAAAGSTKCGLLLREGDYPTDDAFHSSDDPDVVFILSVAGALANPAASEGVSLAYWQEFARWTPPGQLFVPRRIALASFTDNPGALLHFRVWYRLWPRSAVPPQMLPPPTPTSAPIR
ncbi:MAG: hypothetical protein HY683_00055 [Chloroflexi bacterium]|nr:hypothetical protein [Chloroflexota bacterium]